MRTRLTSTIAILAVALSACSARNADDSFVQAVRTLRPSVALLTVKVPPDTHDRKDVSYDIADGSATVIASGAWGSDLLTVAHVVDGALEIRVTVGNRTVVSGSIVARDGDMDVALVRIATKRLPVAKLGDSSDLADDVGREVGLLGYPVPSDFSDQNFGLATSLGSGRLSSVRKHMFEVAMPIVPGESGGPVFLADTGAIVGISDARFDDERSIGFAVPINDAKRFLHEHDAIHGF